MTLEKGGAGAGLTEADGDGATAVVVAAAVVGAAGVGTADGPAGSAERLAIAITAATRVARATMPSAPSTTEVQRRCGVKSGNSVSLSGTADDHAASSASAAALTSLPVPRYSGRVVAVAGVSVVVWSVVDEMVLSLRSIGPRRS
ncbi:hypothetical protein [Mycobacterium sp. DL592]|uniref:hypothetical protein n=1 Tax=Mycobacterium sp. DL592 TaxID=2675524 RepID=UPI00141EF18A|nr:hypothetical protein [Mycobacterium sp. DL592]